MQDSWVIPCNIKIFDVISHFQSNKYVVWRNMFSILPGDLVYIYIGLPISEIRFRCVVLEDQVSEELLKENRYAVVEQKNNNYYSKRVKYIKMRLDKEYLPGELSLARLKENGLGQVQIQARCDRKLRNFLYEHDKEKTYEEK